MYIIFTLRAGVACGLNVDVVAKNSYSKTSILNSGVILLNTNVLFPSPQATWKEVFFYCITVYVWRNLFSRGIFLMNLSDDCFILRFFDIQILLERTWMIQSVFQILCYDIQDLYCESTAKFSSRWILLIV